MLVKHMGEITSNNITITHKPSNIIIYFIRTQVNGTGYSKTRMDL